MNSSQRIQSVDAFRGLTVALMILVNSSGNNTPYPILDHAPWNGCTLADLVFPFFLFIVGLSCALARPSVLNILKRTAMLIALGLFLNAFPNHFHLDTFRFYGVLQRIGVCYGCIALLHHYGNIRMLSALFFTLLIGYALILYGIPDAPQHIDQFLFNAQHLYGKTFDPEGALSTLPALATTLIGYFIGYGITSQSCSKLKNTYVIAIIGLFLLGLGYCGHFYIPWNKTLWTSTYVLWTGGLACLCFSLFYFLIELKQATPYFSPLSLLGRQALFAFVGHVLSLKLQYMLTLPNLNINLKTYLTQTFFGSYPPELAALSYAICHLIFWWLLCYFKEMLSRTAYIK